MKKTLSKLFFWKGILRRNPQATVLFIIVLGIFSSLYIFNAFRPGGTDAAWWNDLWGYRFEVPITAHSSSENNVYIALTVANTNTLVSSGKLQSDCGDIRFTKENGDLMPYYIASGCNSASTVIHVFFDVFPAGAQTIYMYYGNPNAPDGFSPSPFDTEASGYTIGTLGGEESSFGPVGYWAFDEGYGTVTHDGASNGNNGTLTAAVWNTSDQCVSDKCLFYNGNTATVDMGNPTHLQLTSSLTITAWVRPTAYSSNSGIVTKYHNTDGNRGYNLGITATGVLMFRASVNGTSTVNTTSTGTIPLNTWTHVAVVYNASAGTASYYIDGKLDRTVSGLPNSLFSPPQNFRIGRWDSSSSGANAFHGFIDEVKVYAHVLSEAQVAANFNSRGGNVTSAVLGTTQDSALSDGLVGYWKMDETSWTNDCSTTSVIDSSGTGSNGVSCPNGSGVSTLSTGKFGNAPSFDGSNDYVAVSSGTYNLTNNLTLSAWINPNTDSDTNYGIITSSEWTTTNRDWWLHRRRSGLSNQLSFQALNGNQITSTSSIPADTWTHVAFVLNNGVARLYINGTMVVEDAAFGPITTGNAGLNIGRRGDNLQFFNGEIDEARIYNRALSPAEVSQLYNFAPGPVGYWNFEAGQGTTVADSSTYGNNGTWNGTSSRWGVGKYGKGGVFNGTNSYVGAGNNASINNMPGHFTVSAWIYPTSTTGIRYYISNTGDTGTSGIGYGLRSNYSCGSSFEFQVKNLTSITNVCATGALSAANKWYHVAGVFTGTSVQIYVDGVLRGSANYTGAPLGTATHNTALGVLASSTAHYFVAGSMDEIRIYNYARTQAQILEDMNAGSTQGVPIGHWKFDEGTGTVANNSGSLGPAINGTLTNMSSPATATSGWTNEGKINKALNFDAADDTYVDLPNISAYKRTSATISVWFKPTTHNNNRVYSILSSLSDAGADPDSGTHRRGQMTVNTNGTINAQLGSYTGGCSANFRSITSTRTAPLDEWSHAAFVVEFSPAYKASLYINGTLEGISEDTVPCGNDMNIMWIGRRKTNNNFNGSIDEFKLYNYGLTAQEIQLEYNEGKALVLGSATESEYCIPDDPSPCNGPVARYDFEEGQGSTANDTSGNGYNATVGLPRTNNGQYGKGLMTQGGQQATITGMTGLLGSVLTVQAWVNNPAGGSYNRIINRGWVGDGWILGTPSESQAQFCIAQSNTQSCATVTGLSPGKMHLTGIYDGEATYLYINGQLRAINTGAPDGATLDTTSNIPIGQNNLRPMPLDSVRLFDYARTPAQIAWDYNRGGPVAHWKLDECQGDVAHDAAGNNNNGTITIGGSGSQTAVGTCQTASTAWGNGAQGKYNASLNFDGSDDTIDVPHASILNLTGDMTVSAWVKANTLSGLTGNRAIVVTKRTGSSVVPYELSLLNSGAAILSWNSPTDGWTNVSTPANTITTGNWYHIAATRSDAGAFIYVNGVLKGSGVNTVDVAGTTSVVRIGGPTSQYNSFPGQIDDVRMYNYALTPSQIAQVHNQGAAVRFGPSQGTP